MSEQAKKFTDKKSPSIALHQSEMGGKIIAKTKKKNKDKRQASLQKEGRRKSKNIQKKSKH